MPLLVGAVGAGVGMSMWQPIDFGTLVAYGLAAGFALWIVGCLIVRLALGRVRGVGLLWLVTFLSVPPLGLAIVFLGNALADLSTPKIRKAKVVSVGKTASMRNARTVVEVASWVKKGETIRVDLNRGADLSPGEPIWLRVHPGAFGVPWIGQAWWGAPPDEAGGSAE